MSEALLYIDYVNQIRMHNMGHGAMEANAGFSKDFVDCFLYTDGLPKALTTLPKMMKHWCRNWQTEILVQHS